MRKNTLYATCHKYYIRQVIFYGEELFNGDHRKGCQGIRRREAEAIDRPHGQCTEN